MLGFNQQISIRKYLKKLTVNMKKYIVALLAGILAFSVSANAKNADLRQQTPNSIPSVINTDSEEQYPVRFAWGADIGGTIDLSSHGMSAIGIGANFGMSWKWVRFFGIGVSGNTAVSNGTMMYPIFLNFRTDFCNTRQLLFADVRVGVSINNFSDTEGNDPGAYLSAGMGVTMAKSRTFSSHVMLAYTYMDRTRCYLGNYERHCPGMSMVSLRLGIAF